MFEGVFVLEVAGDPSMFSTLIGNTDVHLASARSGSVSEFMKVPMILQGSVAGGEQMMDLPKVTVKEVVKLYAHKLGGVHLDPQGSENPLLIKAQRVAPEAVVSAIAAVGRIVVRALDPLCGALYYEDLHARKLEVVLAREAAAQFRDTLAQGVGSSDT